VKKIPTLFKRDPDDMKRVLSEVTPGCEWVLAGEGVATRKYDGTCCMFDGEQWWARREVKAGKLPPPSFVSVQLDENTGKTVGWVPMAESSFAAWHTEALTNHAKLDSAPFEAGTFELVGPKVNGNPEDFGGHTLIPHGRAVLAADLTPALLIRACAHNGWEGVVWHHPDGRMAKLKVRDFPS
jgi:hypothetical protein